MALIIIITIAIYILLILWMWNSLGEIEKTKKIAIILIGTIIIYIITLIIFNISKQGIEYNNIEIEKSVKNILVAIFSGVNSLIILPYIAKLLNKINEGEIEKNELLKKIFIISIMFIICMFLECKYMKSTQTGILKMFNHQLQSNIK